MKRLKFRRLLAAIMMIALALNMAGCASAIERWDPTGAKRSKGTVVVLCLALEYREVRAATKGKALDARTLAGIAAGKESCRATLASASPSVRELLTRAVCAYRPPAVEPAQPDPRLKDNQALKDVIPPSEKKRVKRERTRNVVINVLVGGWCMMRQQ